MKFCALQILMLVLSLLLLNVQTLAQPASAFVHRPFLEATQQYATSYIGCIEVYYQLRDTVTGQIHGMDDKPFFKKIPVLAVQVGHEILLPGAIADPTRFFPDFHDEIASFPFVSELQKLELYNHKGEQIDRIQVDELDTIHVINSEEYFLYRFSRNAFSGMPAFDSLNYHLKEGILVAMHFHSELNCKNISVSIDFSRKAGVSFDGFLLSVTEMPDSLIGGIFLHPYPTVHGVQFALGGLLIPFKPASKVLLPEVKSGVSFPADSQGTLDTPQQQTEPDPNSIQPDPDNPVEEQRQRRRGSRRNSDSGT